MLRPIALAVLSTMAAAAPAASQVVRAPAEPVREALGDAFPQALPVHGEYDWIRKGGYRGADGDQCCGKDDCYKLDGTQVQEQKDGIHVPAYGVTVPYSEVQRSEDEHYWICRTSAKMRCFFAPLQGF